MEKGNKKNSIKNRKTHTHTHIHSKYSTYSSYNIQQMLCFCFILLSIYSEWRSVCGVKPYGAEASGYLMRVRNTVCGVKNLLGSCRYHIWRVASGSSIVHTTRNTGYFLLQPWCLRQWQRMEHFSVHSICESTGIIIWTISDLKYMSVNNFFSAYSFLVEILNVNIHSIII